MTQEIIGLYKRFRRAGMGGIVGESALWCLRDAKALAMFKTLEDEKVRILAEPETENYFDVFGEPDTKKEKQQIIDSIDRLGCFYVHVQVRCSCCGDWRTVDGVGMCAGYSDPTDPFENGYVPDLIRAGLKAAGVSLA